MLLHKCVTLCVAAAAAAAATGVEDVGGCFVFCKFYGESQHVPSHEKVNSQEMKISTCLTGLWQKLQGPPVCPGSSKSMRTRTYTYVQRRTGMSLLSPLSAFKSDEVRLQLRVINLFVTRTEQKCISLQLGLIDL